MLFQCTKFPSKYLGENENSLNFKGGLLQATLGSPGARKLIPEAPWESKSSEDRFW